MVRTAFDKMQALNYGTYSMSEWTTQNWLKAVEETGYLQSLQTILVSTNWMLKTLTSPPYENVIVHCSDGWDRTSQMSALA